jgi:flavin-dependent dehydrogenase
MPVIGAMLRGVCPRGPVVVRPAQSGHLAPVAGDDWLAVGDAAAGFDPLSSQGIAKALRSGIFASYWIGDLLTRGDYTGLRRYRSFVRAALASYVAACAKHYRAEGDGRVMGSGRAGGARLYTPPFDGTPGRGFHFDRTGACATRCRWIGAGQPSLSTP